MPPRKSDHGESETRRRTGANLPNPIGTRPRLLSRCPGREGDRTSACAIWIGHTHLKNELLPGTAFVTYASWT